MGVKAKMPQALQPCPLAHLLSRASSALWSVCFANTTACKLDLRQSSPEINKHKSKHDYYPTIEKMTGNKQTERTVRTMLTPSASRKARSSPLATAASSFRRASTSNARSEMNITQNNLVGISIGEITEYGFNLLTSDARNMMKHAHDLTCEVGAASEKKKSQRRSHKIRRKLCTTRVWMPGLCPKATSATGSSAALCKQSPQSPIDTGDVTRI